MLFAGDRRRSVYDEKPRCFAKNNKTAIIVRSGKSEAAITNNKRLRSSTVLLKLSRQKRSIMRQQSYSTCLRMLLTSKHGNKLTNTAHQKQPCFRCCYCCYRNCTAGSKPILQTFNVSVLICTEAYGRRLLPPCPHLYPHLKSLKPFNFNNSNQLMPDLRFQQSWRDN